MSDLNRTVRGALGALNDTTPVYKFRRAGASHDSLHVMVYTGTAWVGTVTLQVSDPDQNSWVNVPDGAFTSNTTDGFTPYGDTDIRWKMTAYTSGIAIGAIIGDA